MSGLKPEGNIDPGRYTCPRPALGHAVVFQLAIQGAGPDFQQLGCLFPISAGEFQRIEYVQFLHIGHTQTDETRTTDGNDFRRRTQRFRQILNIEIVAVGFDYHLLYYRAQFAYISPPPVISQPAHRFGGYSLNFRPVLGIRPVKEMPGQ